MAKFITSKIWADNDVATSTALNDIVDGLEAGPDLNSDSTIVVDGGKIRVGVLNAANLAADSVQSGKILDGAVITSKIDTKAVTGAKIADETVTTLNIGDEQVTMAKHDPAALANATEVKAATAVKLVTLDMLENHPGVAKAYAAVDSTGLKSGSLNVASVVVTGGSGSVTTLEVTFTTPMASTNYAVSLTPEYPSARGLAPVISVRSASGFTAEFGSANNGVTFSVFGQL